MMIVFFAIFVAVIKIIFGYEVGSTVMSDVLKELHSTGKAWENTSIPRLLIFHG